MIRRSLGLVATLLVATTAALGGGSVACSAPAADDDEAVYDTEAALFDSTAILSPPVEHFKYGSIGADKLGIPSAVLRAIPIVCADRLPKGTDPRKEPFSAFGLIYEPGHQLPIGFSTRRLAILPSVELTGNNCAVCHTSTVRDTPTSARKVYFGAPATRFDLEGYQSFLMDCIGDSSRFNSTTLVRAFDELGVTGLERVLAYKSGFLRAFLQDTKTKVGSVVRDGAWGPGRDDAIGLSGAILLGPQFVPTKPAPVDFPAVWNQQARKGHALHWDGAAGSALERNVLVAVGAGTPKNGVPLDSLAAVQGFLDKLPAPKYPYAIDNGLATKGQAIFEARCNDCHGAKGSRTLQVTPILEIGTDPNRLDAVSQAGIDKMNSMWGAGWSFSQFKKTNGYLNGPLDGIWLRAPYLHNGSVPTLRDLLKPPAQRPKTFFRGNDVYDAKNVGFVSTVASEGKTTYMLFDTTRQGNGNGGHFGPAYGTNLSEADVDALLEYLKTL